MVQGLSAVEPWLCSVSVKLFGILSRGSCMAKWLNKLCLQHLKYALLAQWWCLTFSILWTWECVHKPICVCVHIYIYECVHSKVDCLVSSFSYHTNVRKWVLYHTQDLVHHQCIHQHISNSVLSHQGRSSELLRVKLWVQHPTPLPGNKLWCLQELEWLHLLAKTVSQLLLAEHY